MGALSHWVISTVIWAIWILFFYFRMWKVFTPNERRVSWMELGVVVTDGGHSGIHFLSNILWEQVSSKSTLAKSPKNLLIFCCEYLHH